MARPAARITRKTGINVVPIIIFVIASALAAAGLFTWDYYWRRQQEAANRPPSPDVLARNLVENIIGADTVKDAKVDEKSGLASITFESATFKPEQAKKDSREFLAAEAELASQAVLDRMQQVKRVNLTLVYKGAPLATSTVTRGTQGVKVTYVDPRVK